MFVFERRRRSLTCVAAAAARHEGNHALENMLSQSAKQKQNKRHDSRSPVHESEARAATACVRMTPFASR